MTTAPEHRLTDELRALQRQAPDSVLPAVLAATGIADRFGAVDGPAGRVHVAWNDRGISAVAPTEEAAEFEAVFADRVGRPLVAAAIPERLAARLRKAFATGRRGTLRLDLDGLTEFQRSVLEATATIPAGELRSYGWVAREIGRPGAVRAVGSALNRNPVPLLIPCHRVGRSDGTIGDYAFGEPTKRALLDAEGLDLAAVEDQASRGVRYLGSDTTNIFCTPTCRNARRITAAHRQEFHDADSARGEGYRPCKVCRPVAA